MNKKYAELAMVDIVEKLLKENNKPLAIQDIFAKIAEIKQFSLDDIEKLTTLYMNITQSGKFVFVGDDKWDLKEGNLDLWSDDGSAFIEVVDDFDDEDEFTKYDPSDYEIFDDEDDFEDDDEDDFEDEIEDFEDDEEEEDLDEETKKELAEEKEYIEVELPLRTSDDDDDIDFDADDFDEDDYEDIMDDYEDMYED